MSAAATGAAVAAAAAQAALINASNGSGLIVRVSPEQFADLLERATPEHSLVVQDHHEGGFLSRESYQYLLSYKGLVFVTRSTTPLDLPPGLEKVVAETLYVPI